MALRVSVVPVRWSEGTPEAPLLCLFVSDESCALLPHACTLCYQRMPAFNLEGTEDHSAELISSLRAQNYDEKNCRLITASHSSGARLQAVGIHHTSLPREQAALLAIVVATQALTNSGLSDDPCRTGLFPQLLASAQAGYRGFGVEITGNVQADCENSPPADPSVDRPQHQLLRGERKLSVAVRGDSLLATRSDTAKKKSYKTFKTEFQGEFWDVFGPNHLDYDLKNGECVNAVTKAIEIGSSYDIMCVGIGINDLLESDESNTVKFSWPAGLDADLRQLGKAIKEKCATSLVIVGGPAGVWKYPTRWNQFVDRAHGVLEDTGVTLVPVEDVSNVMRQMKLSFDGLHFAHDDDTKKFFAKAWVSWLRYYADVKTLEERRLTGDSRMGVEQARPAGNDARRDFHNDPNLSRKRHRS